MTISEAYPQYLIYAEADKRYAAETLVKIKDCFKYWILPRLGSLELKSLRQLNVMNFKQTMTQAGLGVARQYSILITLRHLLKFSRLILEIPTLDPTTIALPRRERRSVEYLTNPEIEQIRGTIDTFTMNGIRLRTLFEVLLSSGMRISEGLSLNRDSIDFNTYEAQIIGKGKRPRTVFFSEEAIQWVIRYLARRKDQEHALFVTTGDPPRRWRRGDIPDYFKAVQKQAEIKKRFTPHLLRHTFCTNLLHNGADITFIKELAGHQDIQTTARYYLGVDKKALKSVLARFQSFSVKPKAQDLNQ